MTVSSTTSRWGYNGDGATVAFAYDNVIFAAADLKVYAGAPLALLVLNTDYTVTGIGSPDGGNVVFAAAPDIGIKNVLILREVAATQDLKFPEGNPIPSSALSKGLDKLTVLVQQLQALAGRKLGLAKTSTYEGSLDLPDPVAGRGLKWSGDGTALVNSATDPDVAAAAAASAADTAVAARDVALGARDTASAAAAASEDARDEAVAAAASVGDPLQAAQNLADVQDKEAARLNMEVYSRDEVDTLVAAALVGRLTWLELNFAMLVLWLVIDQGWSVFRMVGGVADEFADEVGVDAAASSNETYAAGNYYTTETSPVLVPHGEGAVVGNMTSYAGNAAAFDAVTSQTVTSCAGRFGAPVNASVGKQWAGPKTIHSFRVYSPSDGTIGSGGTGDVTYKLFGSNSGFDVSGVELASGTQADGAGSVYDQSSGITIAPYDYHWVTVSRSGASEFRIAEVQFFEQTAPVNMTLVSEGSEAQADEARLVLLHQPIDATTLDTDLIAEASRDDGGTWSAGSLVHEGAFDATTNILACTIDLSAQPASTAMRWRVRTLNTKSQRLHGVWMQWR